MFEGVESADKDPRKSLHVDEVATPELAPDEAYVAVMASSINFNTVWTSIFEPLPTFGFLDRLGKECAWGARHDLPYHVVGSDASGVVLQVGSAVRNWKPGDRVTVHCNHVDDQDPSAHDDSMLAANQRIWGFETNFGGLADLTVVKANQLMPKPAHLTWEEAACNAPVQLHQLPHARAARNARRHEAGRRRAHLGRHRRPRRLRRASTSSTAAARPVGVVSLAREGRAAPRARAASTSSTARRPATSSGPTSTPRTRRSGAASARTSAASSAATPTSCSSTPAARPWAPRCSWPPAAARSSPAPPPAAT